jgi:hypothetical protein
MVKYTRVFFFGPGLDNAFDRSGEMHSIRCILPVIYTELQFLIKFVGKIFS